MILDFICNTNESDESIENLRDKILDNGNLAESETLELVINTKMFKSDYVYSSDVKVIESETHVCVITPDSDFLFQKVE